MEALPKQSEQDYIGYHSIQFHELNSNILFLSLTQVILIQTAKK